MLVKKISLIKIIVFLSFFNVTWITGRFLGPISIATVQYLFLLNLVFVMFYLIIIKVMKLPYSLINISFIFIFLFTYISISWSVSFYYLIRESTGIVFLFLIYNIVRMLEYDNKLLYFIYKILLLLFLISIIYIIIAIIIGAYGDFILFESEAKDRLYIYFIAPSLVTMLVFLTYAFLQNKVYILISKKTMIFILSIIAFYFILNMSKTYFLSIVFAIIIYHIISSSYSKKIVFIALGLIAVYCILFTNNPFSRQLYFQNSNITIEYIIQNRENILSLINSSGRFAVWDYLITTSHESWDLANYFGSGFGTSRYILSGSPIGQSTTFAHGDHARIIAEFGYLGFITYLFSIVYFISYFIRKYKKSISSDIKAIYTTIILILIYIPICGIGYEVINKFTSVLMILVILIAICENLNKKRAKLIV